ncbi:MAG TPA: hypothetical protein PKV97_00325 [Thauera aminoaromatica]|nr:hypothetical protein [Thauera aminoaromatica]
MQGLLKRLATALHSHWFVLDHSDENFYYYECRCGQRSFAYLPGSQGDPDFAWVQGLKRAEYAQLSPNARKSRARREILAEVQPHIARGNALHRRAQRAESRIQGMLRKLMELPQPADRVWVVWDRGAEKTGNTNVLSTRRVFFKASEAGDYARAIGWEGAVPDLLGSESAFMGGEPLINVRVICLPVK